MFDWYFNLKTVKKLIVAFAFIALVQVLVGVFALNNMGKLNGNVKVMYTENLKPLQTLTEADNGFQEMKIKSRDLYLADSPQKREEILKEINDTKADIKKSFDLYRSDAHLGNEQKVVLKDFDQVWSNYSKDVDYANQLIANGTNLKFEEVFSQGDLRERLGAMFGMIEDLIAIETEQSEASLAKSSNMYATSKIIMLTVITFTVILSILFGLYIARIISNPLKKLVSIVEKVAEGNLTETSDIRTKDEVGVLATSINTMIQKLRDIIQSILNASENLSASSEQVSASTEEIASASASQANAAQTINELFNELSEAIRAIAQNTEQAAELSNQTMQLAQEGEKVVVSSVEGSTLVSEQMGRLEEDSNRIGEIINVIDDIADQTNLLALNAAIEAARAGDQGRGFAVVADEVRNLAERSGEATKQITDIIQRMQEVTVKSVKSVEDGVALTRQSGEAFENIIHMISETGQKVTEIAGASEQQAAQSEEVMSFIENISAATEEATASSEETAATSENLINLAEEMNASVAAFKLK